VALLAAPACGDDDGAVLPPGNGGGTPGIDVTVADTGGGGDTSLPPEDTGPAADVPDFTPDGPITRNPACGEPLEGTFGKTVPWKGFAYEGETFTCNLCPGGDPQIQGDWRVVFGNSEDPETPLTDGYKEVVTFDGNTWRQHAAGLDEGKQIDMKLEGWYFCGDKADGVPGNQYVFVITKVTPEGAFGWNAGTAFVGKTFKSGADKLLFGYYTGGWKEDLPYYNDLYCRIGKSVENLNGELKYCGDPFDE
jgi:hypothetical protein